jgi:hypothetical protein
VHLTTGLKGLKLSGKNVTFKHASTLQVDRACAPPHPACAFTNWTGPVSATGTAPVADGDTIGVPGHQNTLAGVARTVPLKAPTAKTARIDFAVIKAKPPVYHSAAKSLSVTSSSSGIVTGSAALGHATQVFKQSLTCTFDGKNYTEHEAEYSSAFASAAGHQFEARTMLTGTIKVAKSGSGFFTLVSL